MAIKINDITRALHLWLAERNLPTEGVELHVVMPSQGATFKAEASAGYDCDAIQGFSYATGHPGGSMRINGIGVRFSDGTPSKPFAYRKGIAPHAST